MDPSCLACERLAWQTESTATFASCIVKVGPAMIVPFDSSGLPIRLHGPAGVQ